MNTILTLNKEINTLKLIKFTFPSIITVIFMSFYTIVDGIFISRFIGTDAFSAINIIFPILSLSIAFGIMFGAGTATTISIELEQKKYNEARKNISFISLFTIFFGIIMALIIFLYLDKIICILGANENIYKYCYEYTYPLIFFIPVSILQFLFESLFVATGKPHISFTATFIGGILNIILDYIFIVVLDIGVAGAAIATGIGSCIPVLFGFLYFLLNRKRALCFTKPQIDLNFLWNVISNGSSEMITNLSISITTFLFNIILMHFLGEDGVAAISIILYIDFLLVAISTGYSVGISPLISFNYSSKNSENLKKIYILSGNVCIITGLSISILTILFSQNLASIFSQKNSHVYNLAVAGLNVYSIGYLFKGFNIFSSALFTALNNKKISAILSFIRTLVLLVISLITFSSLFGVSGIWFASPFTEICAFFISMIFTINFKNTYNYL